LEEGLKHANGRKSHSFRSGESSIANWQAANHQSPPVSHFLGGQVFHARTVILFFYRSDIASHCGT
jgi:hypothetical protein